MAADSVQETALQQLLADKHREFDAAVSERERLQRLLDTRAHEPVQTGPSLYAMEAGSGSVGLAELGRMMGSNAPLAEKAAWLQQQRERVSARVQGLRHADGLLIAE